MLLIGALVSLTSCWGRKGTYDQTTPEATVESLTEMIKNGDLPRIPELIQAEDEMLTRTLRSTAVILLRMQALSEKIKKEYPDEVDALFERIKKDAMETVQKKGEERGQTDWGDRLQAFLIDPGSMFDEQTSRIGVAYVDDETYAVTFDGQPAFGVGMLIRQNPDDLNWYFVWPENIPGLNTKMPKTDAEWKILRSLLKSVANGVEWTEKTIDEGKAKDLDAVWEQTMRNVGPNLAIGWMLYERALKKRPKNVGGGG